MRDETHSTPLHLASPKGSGNTVKLLIRHGTDVNAQDGRHRTPLHLAAYSRSALKGDVGHFLLSHGANGGTQDDRGQTPFQIALSRGLSTNALSKRIVDLQLTYTSHVVRVYRYRT